VGHQPAGFADLELVAADRLFARQPQPLKQQLGAVLHRLEHLGVGVTTHHVIDPVAARGLWFKPEELSDWTPADQVWRIEG